MIATIISHSISFLLTNFTLTFLLLGFIAAGIALARAPRPLTAPVVVEHLTANYMLFAVSFAFTYNAVFHIFLGDYAARYIGWAQSPFQAEVGFASLGFAALGLLAWRGSLASRVAAVVAPGVFMVGCVCGHIYQIMTTGNRAPGNSGLILYMALLVPAVGAVLVWLQHRYARPARDAGRAITGQKSVA